MDRYRQQDMSPFKSKLFGQEPAAETVREYIEQTHLIMPPQLQPHTFPNPTSARQYHLYGRNQQQERIIQSKIAAKRQQTNSMYLSRYSASNRIK